MSTKIKRFNTFELPEAHAEAAGEQRPRWGIFLVDVLMNFWRVFVNNWKIFIISAQF